MMCASTVHTTVYAVVESAEAAVTSSLLVVVVSPKLAHQQWSPQTEGQAVSLGSLHVCPTGTTISLADNHQVHMLRKPINSTTCPGTQLKPTSRSQLDGFHNGLCSGVVRHGACRPIQH